MHLDPGLKLLLYIIAVGVGFAWLAVIIVWVAVLAGRALRWLLDVPGVHRSR